MSVRFALNTDDNYSCGNSFADIDYNSISHTIIVPPECIATKNLLAYSDSNYISESENSTGSSIAADEGDAHRMIGWKIFATIVLQAWRKKRKEAKELMDLLEKHKIESACGRSQLQVYSALVRVEQKRNDELTCQLKRTLSNLNMAKSSCETMSTTLISLKSDKALLERELKGKYEEYDALHSVLAQTKTDLFRSMMETRNLQSQLGNEQRSVQLLENQKNQLINEIYDLNTETRHKENNFKQQLEEKQQQLLEMREKMKLLQPTLDELKEKLNATEVQKNEAIQMNDKAHQLRIQVSELQYELNDSLSNRLRVLWNRILNCQLSTFRYVYIAAYFLLPATPPPTAKFWCNGKRG